MAIYKYSALSADGQRKNSALIAANMQDAYHALKAKKLVPISISRRYYASKRISIEDTLLFFMHINFQLACGVTIDGAIDSFAESHGDKFLNIVLLRLSDDLKSGMSLGEAFENCGVFDRVTVGLLKASEKTGNLTEVIGTILVFLKLQSQWRNSLKQMLTYPTFMLCIAFVALVFCFSTLGPQIIALGENSVSGLTRLAIEIVPKIPELFVGVLFISVVVGLYVLKKGLWRDMLIHIPIIGRLYIALEIWMLFKTLHIGLEARLNFINTLTLAMDAIKCPMLRRDLQVIHDKLLAGYSISDSFSGMQYVPTSMIIALSVGEKGNNLKDSLKHISDSLYNDLCRQVKVLGRVLGHGMILCTGLIFLFIIYSLFQPLYDYIGVVTF